MKKAILIKIGELFLKGLNRPTFERALVQSIKKRIKKFGSFKIYNAESTIYLLFEDEKMCFQSIIDEIKKIFGISTFCLAFIADKNVKSICEVLFEAFKDDLRLSETFKIETKRSDKNFHVKSPEISKLVGTYVTENFKNIKVDLSNPSLRLNIEIRRDCVFIYHKIYQGAKGLPTKTAGSATVLISGGIDSPVAAFMMAKRGTLINAIHFSSPPYTSKKAQEKVERLMKVMCEYSEDVKLFIVHFTKIQEQIEEVCQSEYKTIIGRRLMMKISEKISESLGAKVLITGESLAQVASQTMDSLVCTNSSINMPILRPLIGMDKEEIIAIAKKIKTFDISIEPFEDCCTIFTPRHPNTKPDIKDVLKNEAKLDTENLIAEAVKGVSVLNFRAYC